jgi:hypothetical protein
VLGVAGALGVCFATGGLAGSTAVPGVDVPHPVSTAAVTVKTARTARFMTGASVDRAQVVHTGRPR